MKLYFNRPSPYARKVRVAMHEKRLAGRLEMHEVDPWADPDALHAATPIGKVPALVTDDGMLITESSAIAAYFDRIGDGPALGAGDTAVSARDALAQGLIDAAFGLVIEARRPVERQWPDWSARLRRAIDRTLPRIEVEAGRFDLGDIGVACALAYLDLRLQNIPWRTSNAALAAWLHEASARQSMMATEPGGL